MTVMIQNWVDAQKKTIRTVFDTAWDGMEDIASQIAKVEDSSDAWEKDLQMQSPDEIAQSTEGGTYTRVEVENIRSKTYTHLLYKGEGKVTQEMIEDAKYKQIYDMVKMLARAAKRTVNRSVTSALYNGNSSELSPDGAAVFSTHTLANPLAGRPTTFANYFTGALNATNLKSYRITGRKTLDEHGSLAPMRYNKLIVPPSLEYMAAQLTAPVAAGEPGTANNDQNVVGKSLQVVVNEWLEEASSNATTTYYLQDPQEHRFMLFWRVRPEQSRDIEEASGDALFRVRMRFSRGYSDYRGIAQSIGTTA